MKNTLLILIMLVVLLPVSGHGEETITCVVFESQPMAEVMALLLEETGIKGEIILYPWPRAYRMALDEANVLIGPFLRTEKRQVLFRWLDVPMFSSNGYLYKLRDRTDIHIESLEEAKRYKIGISKNYALPEFLIEQGFDKDLEPANTEELNLKKLLARRVDLVVMYEWGLEKKLEQAGLDIQDIEPAYLLYTNKTYLALSLQTPDEIVERFRKALVKLEEDGVLEELRQKAQE